jgi:hypothetical protein
MIEVLEVPEHNLERLSLLRHPLRKPFPDLPGTDPR